MRRSLLFIVLTAVGSLLAATAFRGNVAEAQAQPRGAAPVFVTNSSELEAVPVRDLTSPAHEPAFYQGVGAGSLANPIVPAVPAGKRFILTYINAFTAGNKADCTLLAGEVGGQFSNSGMIALKPSGTGVNIAVEELFIPLETGTALTVDCTSQLTTFVKMGGYYVQVS